MDLGQICMGSNDVSNVGVRSISDTVEVVGHPISPIGSVFA